VRDVKDGGVCSTVDSGLHDGVFVLDWHGPAGKWDHFTCEYGWVGSRVCLCVRERGGGGCSWREKGEIGSGIRRIGDLPPCSTWKS